MFKTHSRCYGTLTFLLHTTTIIPIYEPCYTVNCKAINRVPDRRRLASSLLGWPSAHGIMLASKRILSVGSRYSQLVILEVVSTIKDDRVAWTLGETFDVTCQWPSTLFKSSHVLTGLGQVGRNEKETGQDGERAPRAHRDNIPQDERGDPCRSASTSRAVLPCHGPRESP